MAQALLAAEAIGRVDTGRSSVGDYA